MKHDDYFQEILTLLQELNQKLDHLIRRQRKNGHSQFDTQLSDFMD